MKRAAVLFEKITDFNNLRLAYLKALRGKRDTPAAIIFSLKADENLHKIKNALESGTYKTSPYHQFKIYDPKERIITAASFEDRIVHHACMNILEPVFEKQFIFHTYACRKNKGCHKAIYFAFKKAKSCKYFLKLDVRKYFDSIGHKKLKELLCKILKDEGVLKVLFEIIDSYHVAENRGLPIGNLTSQFFANFYLSPLDHFVLETLKPASYVRYMDDIIIFSSSKSHLKFIFNEMKNFISAFDLTFKQPEINSCKNGLPFLGYCISDKRIKILNKNRRRKNKKIKFLSYLAEKGLIDEDEFSVRLSGILNIMGVSKNCNF